MLPYKSWSKKHWLSIIEVDVDVDVEVDVEADDDDEAVEVDAMLENVEVVDDTDLINEVAKRVTARLVKAMAKK